MRRSSSGATKSARHGATAKVAASLAEDFEAKFAHHQRQQALRASAGWLIFLLALSGAVAISNINLGVLGQGIGKLADFVRLMLPHLDQQHFFAGKTTAGSFAYWYYDFPKWLGLIWQSVEIAILATAFGFAGALLWSFPAARNLVVPKNVTWAVRRFLEFCRTVPELVSALIFVFAFGPGPLAGVLAIAIHTTGSLGKLFSEVHENAHNGPIEGVRAAGGNWTEIMRFGVMPQVMPNLVSYALLRFEVNVAASTAIGIVGAGGIGLQLKEAIDLNVPQDALAMILMIVVLIFVIDLTSERVRTVFMRGRLVS
jgi:phosphonate transport system permease protein